jgi:phosphopantothenoylcysteine synthetase/decarboxylase
MDIFGSHKDRIRFGDMMCRCTIELPPLNISEMSSGLKDPFIEQLIKNKEKMRTDIELLNMLKDEYLSIPLSHGLCHAKNNLKMRPVDPISYEDTKDIG